MSMVHVLDRQTREPASYLNWPHWRRRTLTVRRFFAPSQLTAPREDGPPWRPCPRCWGQRIELNRDLTSSRVCVVCLGVGEVPSTERW